METVYLEENVMSLVVGEVVESRCIYISLSPAAIGSYIRTS